MRDCLREFGGATCLDRCDSDPCRACDKRSGRYWLFVGANYYPRGGIDDFAGGFDTESDAMEFLQDMGYEAQHDWWQLLDTETWTKLDSAYRDGQWKQVAG